MFQGIKNVINWLPIIWKDRHYDYNCLLKIMEKKLQLMENFFDSEDACTVKAPKTAKQIHVAKNLIKRLEKDEYDDPFFDEIRKKWGELKIINGNLEVEKVITEEDEKKYSKDVILAYENAEKLRKQDKELFCKYFVKYLHTWCD